MQQLLILKKYILITGCKPESAFQHLAFILLCETNYRVSSQILTPQKEKERENIWVFVAHAVTAEYSVVFLLRFWWM